MYIAGKMQERLELSEYFDIRNVVTKLVLFFPVVQSCFGTAFCHTTSTPFF